MQMATIPTVRTPDPPATAIAGDAVTGDGGVEFPTLLAQTATTMAPPTVEQETRDGLDAEATQAPTVTGSECMAGSLLASVTAALDGAVVPTPADGNPRGEAAPTAVALATEPRPGKATVPPAAVRAGSLITRTAGDRWATPVESPMATATAARGAVDAAAEVPPHPLQLERVDAARHTPAPGGAGGGMRHEAATQLVTAVPDGLGLQDSPSGEGGGLQDPALPATPAAVSGAHGVAAGDGAARMLHGRVGTHEWRQALGIEARVLVERGGGSATLRVTPEELGPVEVRIDVDDGRASVYFVAAHAETRAALAEALPRLRDMLASVGVDLAEAGVQRDAPGDRGSAPRVPVVAPPGSEPDDRAAELRIAVAPGLVDEYA